MLWQREQTRCLVTPDTVRPGDAITVRFSADKPVDKVVAARVELGYTNFYSYRWAGRADAAAAAVTDTLSMLGEVGTNYGAERSTSDRVSVQTVPIELSDGVFRTAEVHFRVPSWAPASSPELVQWTCRLELDRHGRDLHVDGTFRVGSGPVTEAPSDRLIRLLGNASQLGIELGAPVVPAGGAVRGKLTVVAAGDLPDADIAVYLQRARLSHPLHRTPGGGEVFSLPIVELGKRIPIRAGQAVQLPFVIPVPADAAPTAEAVHSSIEWFVAARIYYKGISTAPERVRRAIVVTA
ncbi:hypothetical protein [Nocardia stercoris]|uniref:Arrestin-like N-terminal domain-containing protein n=1 Tax=Nocardia stercoris TaxID=2483361 RepID=A0A3M2LDH2_9NOCA|nr:hypothetical protein [Nocardia stercoris]RMI35561.1 hypothetical protein EBN03_04790 [Nocardia stercoris]